MRRDYPERPIVGVGIAVRRDDRILLVRRGRPPRHGQWGLPGGVQELGETVLEAAIREVREETGIVARPAGILTVVDSITRDADGAVRYHYTLVEVAADWVSGEPRAGDDASEAVWATAVEAARLVEWDETRRIIDLALSREV